MNLTLAARWIAVVTLWTSLSTGVAQAAPVVYSQPANFPGGTVFASQNDTAPGGFGNFGTVYDDFTLDADAQITDVHWTGAYFPVQGTITGFTLQFYADNTGQPGSPLLSAAISGNAGEAFLGAEPFGPVFTYSADLPSAFAADQGTTYWLSIVPDLAFPPQWGWYTSAVGNGVAVQDFSGTRTPLATDFAFDLTGNAAAVPEPLSLTLVAVGLIALGCRARRHRLIRSQ